MKVKEFFKPNKKTVVIFFLVCVFLLALSGFLMIIVIGIINNALSETLNNIRYFPITLVYLWLFPLLYLLQVPFYLGVVAFLIICYVLSCWLAQFHRKYKRDKQGELMLKVSRKRANRFITISFVLILATVVTVILFNIYKEYKNVDLSGPTACYSGCLLPQNQFHPAADIYQPVDAVSDKQSQDLAQSLGLKDVKLFKGTSKLFLIGNKKEVKESMTYNYTYVYNISDGNNQKLTYFRSAYVGAYHVLGDLIIFQEGSGVFDDYLQVSVYNVEDGSLQRLSDKTHYQGGVPIDDCFLIQNDKLIFHGNIDGKDQFFWYDLTNRIKKPLPTDLDPTIKCPQIDNSLVAYFSKEGDVRNVNIYDVLSDKILISKEIEKGWYINWFMLRDNQFIYKKGYTAWVLPDVDAETERCGLIDITTGKEKDITCGGR